MVFISLAGIQLREWRVGPQQRLFRLGFFMKTYKFQLVTVGTCSKMLSPLAFCSLLSLLLHHGDTDPSYITGNIVDYSGLTLSGQFVRLYNISQNITIIIMRQNSGIDAVLFQYYIA